MRGSRGGMVGSRGILKAEPGERLTDGKEGVRGRGVRLVPRFLAQVTGKEGAGEEQGRSPCGGGWEWGIQLGTWGA